MRRNSITDQKPRLPNDLGSCYDEIVRQTDRANQAENELTYLHRNIVAHLEKLEMLLTVKPKRIAFYPGKYATKR